MWALLRWVRIGPVRLPCPSLTVLVQLCQSAADTQPRPKHQGEFERGIHGAGRMLNIHPQKSTVQVHCTSQPAMMRTHCKSGTLLSTGCHAREALYQ